MCEQDVNIAWYIATVVLSIIATIGIMYFVTWLHDKKHPKNDFEWLDKHLGKDHYYPDPNGKGSRVGKLEYVAIGKGNRSGGGKGKPNKPNHTFTFKEGNHYSEVPISAKWSLK